VHTPPGMGCGSAHAEPDHGDQQQDDQGTNKVGAMVERDVGHGRLTGDVVAGRQETDHEEAR